MRERDALPRGDVDLDGPALLEHDLHVLPCPTARVVRVCVPFPGHLEIQDCIAVARDRKAARSIRDLTRDRLLTVSGVWRDEGVETSDTMPSTLTRPDTRSGDRCAAGSYDSPGDAGVVARLGADDGFRCRDARALSERIDRGFGTCLVMSPSLRRA
jgi:hypothetical protein